MICLPGRGILAGLAGALALHLAFFVSLRPRREPPSGVPVPPATLYLAGTSGQLAAEARTVGSPVLFSLPSRMGFSRELLERDVRTRLTFSQKVVPERFRPVDPAYPGKTPADLGRLLFTAGATGAPRPPESPPPFPPRRPSARRLNLSPALRERLVGGIVLPPDLNQPAATPWQARASVSVSRQGSVRHVFLDQPIEAALNQQLLLVLYGLRFRPGDEMEGSIDVYSPDAVPGVAGP